MTMTKLPSMGSRKRNRPVHPCICGCGMGTKGTWYPGHDGRATGWAIRIEKGLIKIEDVPEGERNGAVVMLAKRGTQVVMPPTKAEMRARRKAERAEAARVKAAAAESTEQTAAA